MLLSLFLRLYTYCHGIGYYHAGIWGKGDGKLRMHDDEPRAGMIHERVTLTLTDKSDSSTVWFCGTEHNICFTKTVNLASDRHDLRVDSSSRCADHKHSCG